MALESIVEKLITPKIEELAEWCKDKYNEYLIPTAEHFEGYLDRTYNKYSIINTLVFNNSQRLLKDVYIAQSLVKYGTGLDSILSSDNKDHVIRIDKIPVELIRDYKKILITDTAGMGKSTIMKRMFIDLIDRGLKDVGIPIYIELNRLNKDRTLLEEIQEELRSLSKEFDKDLLLKLIQTGGFIFFLDGYDEIPVADRTLVTQDIQSFISKAGTDNYYILTSRPEGRLPSFGDFQSFTIKPLTKQEAFELLSKYDMTTDKVMSTKLIDLLKSGKYDSIDEYLKNPLLVSLLFIAYDYRQEIPLKKHEFYRQVFDALFDAHKLAQGHEPHERVSGLDVDDFNRVLRYVGYECLVGGGLISFDKDKILGIIRSARKHCDNIVFKESDFLDDLLLAVPLFCKDGTEYKWVHKSLMEYFAARFIADDESGKQDDYLRDIYNDDSLSKYANMLDLYYDIDYMGLSKSILLPYLEEYVRYYNDHYPKEISIEADLIEARIGSLYRFYCAGIIRNCFVKDETIGKTEGISDHETELLTDKIAKSMIDSLTNNDPDSINDRLDNLNKLVENQTYKLVSYLADVHDIWTLYTEKSLGKSIDSFLDEHSFTPSKLFAAGLYQDFCVLALYTSDKYHVIQRLLFDKQPNLFNQYSIEPVIIDDNLYKENRVYTIDVMSGEKNTSLYVLINNLLASVSFCDSRIDVNYRGNYYLNYKAVKKEIEQIRITSAN